MTVASRARVGDRVERAIEDRADVEQVIERGEAQPTSRKRLVRRAIWLAITAISLYLVFPSLLDLFSSWKDLNEFGAGWLGRWPRCSSRPWPACGGCSTWPSGRRSGVP